jgi:mannosyltransferase OCH1-like enzyme
MDRAFALGAGAPRRTGEKLGPMILNLLWSMAARSPAPPALSSPAFPNLVHLVYGLWDDGPLPWRLRAMLGSWLRHHRPPKWRIVLWNRRQAEELVRARYPDLAEIYAGYSRPVQRADLLRYLLLHEFGGFYADLDILCVSSLSGLLPEGSEASIVVQVEKLLSAERAAEIGRAQSIRQGRPELPERIANYFMGCRSGHPLMAEVIALARERSGLEVRNDYDVLYTTGPDVMSEVIARHRERPDLVVLPRERAEAFLRHFCRGSWRQS